MFLVFWSEILVQIRQVDSRLAVGVLGVGLQQVHDVVVELLRRLLGSGDPVVDLPVVGGQVDEAIVLAKLIWKSPKFKSELHDKKKAFSIANP